MRGRRTGRPASAGGVRTAAVLLLTAVLGTPAGQAVAAETSRLAIREDEVVLFLGDELVDAPDSRISTNFPYLVELFLTARYPDLKARYLHSGWTGDTAGRALLRLDRDVLSRQPTLVVVCLGLNDPGYLPYSHERLVRYRRDLKALAERLNRAGARVWLISPPTVGGESGKAVRVYRDGAIGVADLEAIRYNETLARYSAAAREVAAETGSGFVDWTALSGEHVGAAPGTFGRDGRLPGPRSHTAIAAALLRALGAEPIQVAVEFDWNEGLATISSPSEPSRRVVAEVLEDGQRILVLEGLPLAWPMPGGRATWIQADPQAASLCQLLFRVTNPPTRGITLKQDTPEGGPSPQITLRRAEIQEGFSLAASDALRTAREAQELLTYVGWKNFYAYSTWRRQELEPRKEPELAAAQAQLIAAMWSMVQGHERIIQRLPRTFSVRLVLREALPPERLPTAPPFGPRPRFSPSSRPGE
ncbi:MAG: hypothetical protein AMXMBFR13_05330 [Phycisphaerae bacterium]